MQHFLEHLAPGMESRWQQQVSNFVSFDNETKSKILQQIATAYGATTIDELEKSRDEKEIAVVNALNNLVNDVDLK